MNTLELEHILRSDCKLSIIFEGVFASDRLPKFCASKSALVINLDPHNKSGSHWVCIYIEDGKGEYFDSYGLPPVNVQFVKFLNDNCIQWKFNPIELQQLSSNVCGHYCIWFLSQRSRGLSMIDIIEEFTSNCIRNDEFVKRSVQDRYKSILEKVTNSNPSVFSEKICQCCIERCRE